MFPKSRSSLCTIANHLALVCDCLDLFLFIHPHPGYEIWRNLLLALSNALSAVATGSIKNISHFFNILLPSPDMPELWLAGYCFFDGALT